MPPWNIDALRGGPRPLQLPAIAIGLAVLWAAYLFSLNRNVLYLGFLAASYIVACVFFRHYMAVAMGLGLLAFLAVFPVKIPPATFIEPPAKREDIDGTWAFVAPPISGAWEYPFEVRDLEKHRRECGGTLRGNLVINGFRLRGLVVDAGGKAIPSVRPQRFFAGQQLQLPLDEEIAGKFVVKLKARPEGSPRISLGTEAHGSTIYGDAVWIEFRNERCVVLYHARRRALPATAS
jgi:hypothetical protein